jgi:GntR family transcriptional regulator / MocR family aminotransferase
VARCRAVHCDADQVIVLNGSQQALDFCARLFVDPGDAVAFEDPGYLGIRRILEAHGADLQPVRVDQEGIVVADIDPRARVSYVTPSHQFPTGVALSLPRRLELIEWARRKGGIIIEDDYDSEYRYSGAPLPALQGLGGDRHVVYCGTFSKVMFPSLRLGYAIVPKPLAALFARLKWLSDRHTSLLEQAALADFLREGHLDRHIRRMRRLYASRRSALVQALDHHFGDRVRLLGDPAGMHLLAQFADDGIEAAAARSRIRLLDAAAYYLERPPRNTFLFGFAGLDEHRIRMGVMQLAAASASAGGSPARPCGPRIRAHSASAPR